MNRKWTDNLKIQGVIFPTTRMNQTGSLSKRNKNVLYSIASTESTSCLLSDHEKQKTVFVTTFPRLPGFTKSYSTTFCS